MLTDFRDPTAREHYDADICIVGSGAAGIAMALRLSTTRLRVCLLESGGFELEPEIQALYEAESIGQERASPLSCRLRYFGGTTNHWQGWCAPLEARDFEKRTWVRYSGWPIKKADLDPFYAAAQELLELGEYRYEADELQERNPTLAAIDPKRAVVRYWQYSPPTRFGTVYREPLRRARNVEVVLHANAVKLHTDAEARAIQRIDIQNLLGRQGTVRARAYVLACGGMENARLLLQTNDVKPQGLGNQSGALGRFFMQHPERKVASIVTDDGDGLLAAFGRRNSEVGWIRAHLACSTRLQRELGLLNAGFDVLPYQEYGTGYQALRGIANDAGAGQWPADLDTRVWSVLSDLDGLAGDVYRRVRGEVSAFNLIVHAEQTPNPDSRIWLTNDRDRLGLPKLKVDWRLSREDKRAIVESTLLIGQELGRLKLGRLKLEDWLLSEEADWPENIWSGCHQMGTTRMSDDINQGVVDRNARVHGVRNLYLAGSSVFPTGGYVPPTLTIVALALRLVDHLHSGGADD
jgi:choline dehydrogenase-like flavoprotein